MLDLEWLINPTKLEHCYDIQPLADLLKVDRSKLLKFLYSGQSLYTEFEIFKKNGHKRLISSPNKHLKFLQHQLKAELEKYYLPRAATHGFVKHKSIITNAAPHLRKRHILNLDLEDFFGTITFGRVKRLLESKPFSLPHNVASVVAHICCHDGTLPQGAPTSPIVSNIVAFKLDNQLMRLAQRLRCTYTRYADDITFSFNQTRSHLPKEIVDFKDDVAVVGNALANLISSNGFKINYEKTRLQANQNRQAVTNITVNEKLNVNRRFLRQTSSMLHAALKFGLIKAEAEYFDKYHKGYTPPRHIKKRKEHPGLLMRQKIRGRLNFIRSVRGETCPLWRNLMFRYTVLIGEPNEDYTLTLEAIAARSTVVIRNTSGEEEGIGSGFMLQDVGLITNQHVLVGIDTGCEELDLCIDWLERKHTPIDAQVAFREKKADVALITSKMAKALIKPLKIEPAPDYHRGTNVTLIGYPNYNDGDRHSSTKTNIIGEYGHGDAKRIKVREPIYHGMSGGVVLNDDGRVVGVVSEGIKYGTHSQMPFAFIPITTLTSKVEKFRRAQMKRLLGVLFHLTKNK